MKKIVVALLAVAALTFVSADSFAGFGGSRGGGSSFSSGRSSFGGSRSSGSSFGGSRSSGGSSSSFGGSRSGSSAAKPSSGSSFGGSRASKGSSPAPIVRRPSPSSPSNSSSATVNNHYYNNGGYGGGYGYGYHPGYGYGYGYGGGGFVSGFMWGQFFNRPQVVYVGGNSYVAGDNGQPMVDAQGQPVEYHSNPLLTALAALVWILILGCLAFVGLIIYRSYNA